MIWVRFPNKQKIALTPLFVDQFQPPRGPLNTPFFDNKPMSRTVRKNDFVKIVVGWQIVFNILLNLRPRAVEEQLKCVRGGGVGGGGGVGRWEGRELGMVREGYG